MRDYDNWTASRKNIYLFKLPNRDLLLHPNVHWIQPRNGKTLQNHCENKSSVWSASKLFETFFFRNKKRLRHWTITWDEATYHLVEKLKRMTVIYIVNNSVLQKTVNHWSCSCTHAIRVFTWFNLECANYVNIYILGLAKSFCKWL